MKIEHNRKLFWIIIFLVIVLIAIVVYAVNGDFNEDEIIGCLVDSECVPSSCCHSESCVLVGDAPECNDIFCSQECSGPLDCGAGDCGCVDKKCVIKKN